MTGLVAREVRAFWLATIFFTRLPLPSLNTLLPEDERRATTYWPLLGACIGALMAGVWWLAARIWPPGVAIGLALAAGLLLTGALHEDGFADVCDGLGGGGTRERALDIMRDSRIGAFGAIGIVMLIMLKWQAMVALPPAALPGTLIAAHSLGRAILVPMTLALPYARTNNHVSQRLAARPDARLGCTGLLALAPLLLIPQSTWPGCLAATSAVWFGCFLWFRRRLGGYTGDCLGATQQLSETAVLLASLAAA